MQCIVYKLLYNGALPLFGQTYPLPQGGKSIAGGSIEAGELMTRKIAG